MTPYWRSHGEKAAAEARVVATDRRWRLKPVTRGFGSEGGCEWARSIA